MADFFGTDGPDVFFGTEAADNAVGRGGNDTLYGFGGADTLTGLFASDYIDGGEGDDYISTYSALPGPTGPYSYDENADPDTVLGGGGNDLIFAGYGDTIDGGSGVNRLSINFLGAPVGVIADFSGLRSGGTVTVAGAPIANIQDLTDVRGSNFADRIVGFNSSQGVISSIFGFAGDDTLVGGSGTNFLSGGDGADTIDARGASPQVGVDGGAGDDILYAPATGNLSTITGGTGNDLFYGGGGIHLGGEGNDTFQGGALFMTAYGEAGDDTMTLGSAAGGLFGGSGADTITGSAANDVLSSSDALGFSDSGIEKDQIVAGAGEDSVSIGYGDDADGGDGALDRLSVLLAGAGGAISLDVPDLRAGGTIFGGTIRNFERVELRATEFADRITVLPHAIELTVEGGGGDDVITTTEGLTTVRGGAGNDRLVSGPGGDSLDGGEGIDTLDYRDAIAPLSGSLGALGFDTNYINVGREGFRQDAVVNFENIDASRFGDNLGGSNLANLLRGFEGDDSLAGNGGADTLIGGEGNDVLNGGFGTDTLDGGVGSDIYLVDDQADLVIEAVGMGMADTVYSVYSYTLPTGAEIENFAAATAISTVGVLLNGNQFGQAIAGSYGNDVLRGGGSAVNGGDILIGLRGDDLYFVDAVNILLIEATGSAEGNDRAVILDPASGFTLNGDSHVETLSAGGTTAPINITGNLLSQTIEGNSGNNVLSTGGGGDDTLSGGTGDDIYRVHGTVTVIDSGGFDIVYTSGDFATGTFFLGADVISAAVQADTAALNLAGSIGAETLIGNYGVNVLSGRGGNDTLIGLEGADTFILSVAPTLETPATVTIRDFATGIDRIGLLSGAFSALTAGGVTAEELAFGTVPLDADDRLIFDRPTGNLFYDADGAGTAFRTLLLAQLPTGSTLSSSDFIVVATALG